MTLAALLLASTSANAEINPYAETFVGDTASVGDNLTSQSQIATPVSNYAPVSVGDLQPASYSSCDGCETGTCDSGCDTGCDSGCDSGPIAKRMRERFNLCNRDGWIRSEALIMFMEDRYAPALVTSNDPGLFTSLDQPGVVTEFGETLDGGVSGGFRIDIGSYISDDFGIGGRFTWIGENGDDYAAAGTEPAADRSLGVPFFDTNISGENAEIINQDNLFAGNVQASFATEIYGAEAYARMALIKNKSAKVEFLAGYSYWNLEDMISLTTSRVQTNPATGTTTNRFSLWETENEFNGGQLGFEMSMQRGRWSSRLLSKVHLGNMQRMVNIVGTSSQFTPPGAPTNTNSSLLVDARQGQQTSDEFAFIPEMNFALGYRFRDHVSFTVGYNFMYFDEVALAGEQINRVVDGTTAGQAVAAPTNFTIRDGGLWVQGLTLGASVDY
ncbi:MAG: BBP7 family outer membrane beta-barrel protein [Planctomycetota bacterium]